ncbi:amidohydrolase|uniref:Amidohydrolase n=1 Tax=Dendrosporobacter quercicolus TaxID=146817 RepID=A0A1G9RXM4_9FIRM|nr:amidohydrolase [Dendrosporobacter quercicolus]NSL49309.1 amidohydrolase [Dendrosporobacter quercicolus DSM 1736]SDM27914.1 amidohydrolase [Dendrosporobacter quercicolus]
MPDIGVLIKKHTAAVVALRRYFHTYPELSGQEYNTQKRVLTELRALGIEAKPAADTGVIADIAGPAAGPVIAIRADMDALRLQDECGQTYQSVNHGVCHACGHDGHVAMLLGVAKVLAEMQEQLAGTVRLLFQPSEEEFPGGAQPLIEAGALKGVAAIISAHLWQTLAAGTIGISYDRLMAAPDAFTITVQGKGGHGSMPQQTIDPILTGAQIVMGLHTIVGRNIDPLENAVVSLGSFKAGEAFNVIPDIAVLKGTVRSFDHALRLQIFERIEAIARGISQASGASCTVEKKLGFPPLVNSPEIVKTVVEAAGELLPADHIITIKPVMAGEDFSCYLQKIPGMMIFVGSGNAAKNIIYPQHHPKFDIDETALPIGMEVLLRSALKLLNKMK